MPTDSSEQPINVAAQLWAELRTVGDIKILGQFLRDLGVPDEISLGDQHSVSVELPIKEWSLSRPSTVHLILGNGKK